MEHNVIHVACLSTPELSSFTSPLPHQACPPGCPPSCPPSPGCQQANDSDHDEDEKDEDDEDKHDAVSTNDDDDEEEG